MTASPRKKMLIVGASFAGLTSAYFMHRLGFDVTVVEIAPRLRSGGTAVNIRDDTIAIVRQMGILTDIRANRLALRRWDFKNADDSTARSMVLRGEGDAQGEDEYEIERDLLMQLLYDTVRDDCEIVFGDTVAALDQADHVRVTFKHGGTGRYDLVLGCDGIHSRVRELCFGPAAHYTHFLQQYFAVSIVDKLLIPRDTAQMFNVPGKVIMLNAYKNKTDIIFGFISDTELAYDYRDQAQQRQMIVDRFRAVGWRAAQLLGDVAAADNFYFDKMCQVRMPAWSRRRVALVGDAAYCPSPGAGRGGSLAIDGAAALGHAMAAAGGDHALAFQRYDAQFRPVIEPIQADAARTVRESLIPRTAEDIRARNARDVF
ncbi:FAD-binding monooxygenase [Duganella sp. Leaf126]|uniref:FAD-dependent monooxygenase n=1 Tax=Duganella sp. Leaf126 TaxID=1736266 RepID=UPI00070019BD|nr:FAD-dependent monooxygenase [Duganella sp. Leaf126]KQQ36006.1 FAD-binding monooxygenase [Duganella sp. Leaf126]